MLRMSKAVRGAVVVASAAALTLSGFTAASAATPAETTPAETTSATAGLTAPQVRVMASFDIGQMQQPDNIVLESGGSVVVSLLWAGQVARVFPDGTVDVLASFDGGTAAGMVRGADGYLYVLHRSGNDPNGLYRIVPGNSTPQLYAALPDVTVPNGLAVDGDVFYLTDSSSGVVWKVEDGTATEWLSSPVLAPATPEGFGANGLHIKDNALWVAQAEAGLLTRVPMQQDGSAGTLEIKATGLTGIDDWVFTGNGDEILAAINRQNKVVVVHPDGTNTTFVDGINSPTSVALKGNKVYISSADLVNELDPKLLVAKWSPQP
ncbi:SMP-30/gluconolactonase/LRE family protein [Streptomyces sp. NPDC093252]|uniref:SMP-30/gluconolactonase/LRE family protein n=1 Tax=Streptomyces sp. NPDC093252 TaxID=3154980 RepID=UPI00343F6466